MTIASILGEFASNITFEYLPKEVVKRAKACIIDTLGVIIGGIDTEQSRKVVSLVEEMGGKQEATVFGGKRKAPAINAALANGTTAHALDLDDGHAMAQLHPGSCVIPAALAMSEREDSSGRDLITAVIVGYEVMIRIGMAINPGHRDRGFHSTGTCGVFGAAAACGKILGLDAEEMVSALGLAGTQSSGLLESDHRGTMAKALHAGRAAQNGAYSAMLAKMGFTGPDTILEGREGFFRAYGERCRMEEIERGLGVEYEIMNTYFKRFPVCAHLDPALGRVLELFGKKELRWGEIKKILVLTYRVAAEHSNYTPKSVGEAKQSLPYSIAILLKYGELSQKAIERSLGDKEIEELSRRVEIRVDDAMDSMFPEHRQCMVKVFMDEREYEVRGEMAKGELEDEEIVKKFVGLTNDWAIEGIELIKELENLPSIKDMTNFLSSHYDAKKHDLDH